MLNAHYQPTERVAGSMAWFERARKVAPLGAHGDGKYYAPYPHFLAKGAGSKVYDVDGNEYIDYWNGAGPTVLGHADPVVDAAVAETMRTRGTVFCAPSDLEVLLGEAMAEHVPCAEMSGFLNAGSDVLYMAGRVARAVTGRKIFVKFAGSYHGWHEDFLFNVSSYAGPPGNNGLYKPIPETIGLKDETIASIRVLDYNDLEAVKELFRTEGEQIAGIVVEPVMHGPLTGNIVPLPGFLEGLRALCTEYGALLIFDEILTGFRHHIGGAQAILGVTPDIGCFGKAISNGLPIAAISASAAIMERLAPAGRAFFSGTYNGNVASVSAALATIGRLADGSVHAHISALGERLRAGLDEVFARRGVAAHADAFHSIIAIHNSERRLHSLSDVHAHHDMTTAMPFASFLFDNGIYAKPRKVQRLLVSAAHTEAEIDRTIEVVDRFYAA
ncbi:aspartate aminotransferase family protein [Prosthecomicrobium pneumaticum]|uniref:Glutamate-1-semialdehyde 2,1-aminomutase n=1 Tax=Prosthecomicrobium pneumaticum TaxID=81895 RepID=A0A7W9CTV4_9HYPH|nr:aminotransferase class III-fold pyridoxal phosphate-dependent enzyme [Prosthecomicrobium pneumaticum]MBB5751549.1 glutamate-1-semialdehyde 2,1-aminomutase [Prosthecomicrobium pneumaticum]